MSEVTSLLAAIARGDPQAAGQLLPLVYEELRRLAAVRMAAERPGQTLDATALVHEAYLRLVGEQRFAGQGHFFAAAAEAMRRILVEQARRKRRIRHGGGRCRVELGDVAADRPADDLIAIDEALEKLAVVDARAAELVKLHYFAGLTMAEAAAVLGVSERKAYTLWAYARSWLFRCLEGDSPAVT